MKYLPEIIKKSNTAPTGYMGVANQSYMPTHARREFTPEEEAALRKGKKQLIPKIFQSYATPLPKLMASPVKQGLGTGLAAGGLAGGASSLVGVSPGTALLLAALVGGPVGLTTYFNRKMKNEDIEELMRRSPVGATKRDMLSDPVLQAEKQRTHDMQRAMVMAGVNPKYAYR
jgi:hypothetical protein